MTLLATVTGTQITQKSRYHLKIPNVGRMTWSKFHHTLRTRRR